MFCTAAILLFLELCLGCCLEALTPPIKGKMFLLGNFAVGTCSVGGTMLPAAYKGYTGTVNTGEF